MWIIVFDIRQNKEKEKKRIIKLSNNFMRQFTVSSVYHEGCPNHRLGGPSLYTKKEKRKRKKEFVFVQLTDASPQPKATQSFVQPAIARQMFIPERKFK